MVVVDIVLFTNHSGSSNARSCSFMVESEALRVLCISIQRISRSIAFSMKTNPTQDHSLINWVIPLSMPCYPISHASFDKTCAYYFSPIRTSSSPRPSLTTYSKIIEGNNQLRKRTTVAVPPRHTRPARLATMSLTRFAAMTSTS
jgi:hypothetical protein